MPTYEYRCRNCGEQLEVVQSFTDDPLTECPACSGQLRKVFQPVGIAFKGSGFYKNDSRPAVKSSSGSDGSSAERKAASTSSDSSSDSSSSGASGASSNGDGSKSSKSSSSTSSSSSSTSSSTPASNSS
jgi:putative FmdB family regulatory protein